MKSVAILTLAFLTIAQIFCFDKNANAESNNYWLTGYYEDSKLIYNGNTLKVQKKWRKSILKQGSSYSTNQIKFNKKIRIWPKCVVESGDDEMITMPLKKYVKKFDVKKGDVMTSVSMEIKVVKGEVVKIGFYAYHLFTTF